MTGPRLERLREERGGIVVLVALLTPFIVLLIALAVEIGNWYEHKRHLQLQVDAAALAAAGLWGECLTSPSTAEADMESEASTYGGSTYNQQVGGASGTGAISTGYQSATFPGSGLPPDDTADGQSACDSAMFDVKATEAGIPNIFSISPLATVRAHARVELRVVDQQKGLLPIAVPDVRFNWAFATFVDESSGQTLGTEQLEATGTSNGLQLWSTPSPIGVPITSTHVGLRLRLVAGTDPNAACGQLFTECYDAGSANGVVHIRGWDPAQVAPTVHNAWLQPGTCSPDAYFATTDCSAGVAAEVDLGPDHPLSGNGASAQVWASVEGSGKYQLSGSGSGLVTWTLDQGLPVAGPGPHTVSLAWSWQQTQATWKGKTCKTGNGNPCTDQGSFGVVQRAFVAGPDRSGPVQRLQVYESGSSSMGANSFQQGASPTLGVSMAVTGSLKVQAAASDPPVIDLRVLGSQNQSIDCDPSQPNLRDEIASGCSPWYKLNPELSCPPYNGLWSTAQPWGCVLTQTGKAWGQVVQGLQDRIFGGANTCMAPNAWPDYSQSDPRIVPLIVTPFGSFSGNGNDILPVIDFGAFYVLGYNGDPCSGDPSPPKGYIAGHFIKYIPSNPQMVGDGACYLDDPTQIAPCVAVLTR